MKTVNVSELECVALDYAVAVAAYNYTSGDVLLSDFDQVAFLEFRPSTDWSQGGPVIDSNIVSLTNESSHWSALAVVGGKGCASQFGPAPLIAACRAIVAAHFGDTVEVPEVLL